MAKRIALYLRVSTDSQSVENQRRELMAAAKRHGWAVAAEFADEGISGSRSRDKRPALDAMLKAVTRHQFDLVAAWSVDRLGRSLQDLLTILGELQGKEIGLYLHQQGIDTTTPAGKAMFQMLGVFAEYERSMIRERVRTGLARAAASGKRLGRPRVSKATEDRIRKSLQRGTGILKTARALGVGVGTVQRVKNVG